MQALRLARPARLAARPAAQSARRTLAATASTAPSSSPAHAASATQTQQQSVIPLSNVEAQWESLSQDEQLAVHQQLEEVQKKDWKALSVDEKKAAYYVAFGPHGPRAPVDAPGAGYKTVLSVIGLMGVAGAIFVTVRSFAPAPPKTISKEWEEASNERALEQKMNPISGIASEGYSGRGFVTHK